MRKNICLLGCVMLGALAACSTGSESASRPPDPALVAAAEAAVITESEPVPERLQRRFANELRILNENNMTRETITNGDGSLRYCQGVYNEDQPGRPAILVFLHGIGERGSENLANIRIAVPEIVKQIRAANRKVVLLAPQCPADQLWSTRHRGGAEAKLTVKPRPALGMVPVLIQKKIVEFDADPDRVYITGLSLGGYGTWDLMERYGTGLFAAGVTCSGGGDPAQAEKMKDLPIRIFHGDADQTLPVNLSRRMYAALKEAGSDVVFYTEYPGVPHDCWTRTYQDPEVWKWLFSQKRGVRSDIRPEQGEVVNVTQEEFDAGF
jgi:predicted esterase